MALCTWVWCK